MSLPPALPGATFSIDAPGHVRMVLYHDGPTGPAPPVLLVHSINAAASAYEVRPLYVHLAQSRPTYAVDLPGFGLSERSDREYSVRLYTDAVQACVDELRRRHGPAPVHVLALSLSSEFAARAATEAPASYRSLALVSPTGFDGAKGRYGPPGSTRLPTGIGRALSGSLIGGAMFGGLTSPRVIRYFLERTFGSKTIDEGMWAYDVLTVGAPGARHAPLYFVSGGLFSNDITRVYEALTVPVWMSHGVRGDFTDYRGADRLRGRPGWSVDVFQTGAMPHFEVPGQFLPRYDAFLAAHDRPAAERPAPESPSVTA